MLSGEFHLSYNWPSYYVSDVPLIYRFLDFFRIIFDPYKSIVPWTLIGYALYHLYNKFIEKLEDGGYVNPVNKLKKSELSELVSKLIKDKDRLIIERNNLKKELNKIRKGCSNTA